MQLVGGARCAKFSGVPRAQVSKSRLFDNLHVWSNSWIRFKDAQTFQLHAYGETLIVSAIATLAIIQLERPAEACSPPPPPNGFVQKPIVNRALIADTTTPLACPRENIDTCTSPVRHQGIAAVLRVTVTTAGTPQLGSEFAYLSGNPNIPSPILLLKDTTGKVIIQ
jgi:hypothetical protein